MKKNDRRKEIIKKYYLSVSDKGIAERLNITTLAVTAMRLRMGLKKPAMVVKELQDFKREQDRIDGKRSANFDSFWNG